MIVAKVIDGKKERFVEIVKQGRVMFDGRDGWVLTKTVEEKERKKQVKWYHPMDNQFVWVRSFA